MFKWTPFPFIRFSIFLGIGIILFDFSPELWEYSVSVLTMLLISFLALIIWSNRDNFYNKAMLNGCCAFLLVGYMGGLIAKYHNQNLHPKHYSHITQIDAFSGSISSGVLEKEKYFRYEVTIDEIRTEDSIQSATGKIHFYLKKPVQENPAYGDRIFVRGNLSPIPPPMNPSEFDYASYMRRNQVFSQTFVAADRMSIVERNQKFSIVNFSLEVREWVRQELQAYFPDAGERQIAMALLVGVKDYLDQDMKKAYSTAGATHVLAVSGLHVGIIYVFISFLMGKLQSNRTGRYLFMVIAIAVIWLYALVTGLSASVFRAACMFSILSIADATSNRRNIFNSLGIAAFVLLIVNPQYLFQVGFQLSFLAVLGIVYLFPRIYGLIKVNNYVLDKIWGISSVSLAAQISTAPLSLFYFHQFPTYFLISNLIVIPAAFVILLVGLPMLAIGTFSTTAGSVLAWVLSKLIWLLNTLVQNIEALPASKLDWLMSTPLETFLIYLAMIGVFWTFQYRTFSSFAVAAGCLLLFFGSKTLHQYQTLHKEALVIYELKDQLAIDLVADGHAQLVVRDSIEDLSLLKFQIDPNRLNEGLLPIESDLVSFSEVFDGEQIQGMVWKGLRVLYIGERLNNHKIEQPIQTDILLVSGNVINEEQLLKFKFDHLVFDGNCSGWYLRKMRSFCERQGIEAHFISQDGYWAYDFSNDRVI
ncbi:MAG: ComEC/Rec2 family competence protein [Cytophagales bacterium]|nr:ComEC/Rec2 family competence protein [Cytophagales bacterium]